MKATATTIRKRARVGTHRAVQIARCPCRVCGFVALVNVAEIVQAIERTGEFRWYCGGCFASRDV